MTESIKIIRFLRHDRQAILEWMKSDRKEIYELRVHRKWIKEILYKDPFNAALRKRWSSHLRVVEKHIDELVKTFNINYKENYKVVL